LAGKNIDERCNYFGEKAKENHQWVFNNIIKFLQFQKERVQQCNVTSGTLKNFLKAIKLFCEMADIPIAWKKITRGLPKVRRYADNKAPTIEELQK
jgi:coenzyme F420-reducing hydrogenase delta subunit